MLYIITICKKESSCAWNAGNVLEVTTPVGYSMLCYIITHANELCGH